MSKERDARMQIVLSQELKRKIETLSKQEKTSNNDIVIMAIKNYMEESQKQPNTETEEQTEQTTAEVKEKKIGKVESFLMRRTNFSGLWRNPRTGTYSSTIFQLDKLKAFEGPVRLWVIPNRRRKEQKEGAPTHLFWIQDATGEDVIPDEFEIKYKRYQDYSNEEPNEDLYTADDVRELLGRAISECWYWWGYCTGYGSDQVLVSDFI